MRRIFISIIVLGIIILIAGFVFDSIFVNIPPQDPPADILQKYMNNYSIAHLIYIIGLIIIAVGIISIFANQVLEFIRKRR